MAITRKKPAKPRARRSNFERTANTRRILLRTAIDALYRYGYSATTTMLVAERAGLSRGTMLHHFPTKTDLMIFVVQSVYEEDIELYKKLVGSTTGYKNQVLAFTEAAWKVLNRPAGIAVLEIMLGSRSDKTLAARLRPLQAKIESDSRNRIREEIGRQDSTENLRLIVWAMRGLSIGEMLAPQQSQITDSVKLLTKLISLGIESGVIGEGKQSQVKRQ